MAINLNDIVIIVFIMPSKEKQASGGLMSSAGLTTYYDSEEEDIALDPKTVVMLSALVSVFFTLTNIFF